MLQVPVVLAGVCGMLGASPAVAQAESAGAAEVEQILAQLQRELGGLLGQGTPAGYAYTDAEGRQVRVQSLQEVPEALRPQAVAVHERAPAAEPNRPPGPEQFYKYRDANGREVYTNIVEQIPVEDREAAKLDLSQVPLNSELGTEISERLQTAHGKIVDSAYCRDLRAHGKQRALKQIWDDHAPLIICLGLLVLLFCASPVMIRKVGGPSWARVLTMAVPALTIAGIMMWSMRSSNQAVVKFRHAMKAEGACSGDAFEGMSGKAGALAKQFELLRGLTTQMQSRLPPMPGPGGEL